MTKAGAGPRKASANMAATKAAETVNCDEYRAARSSAITALIVKTAANGLTRGAAGDRVSPTTPTHTIPPATAVASTGRARRWASDMERTLPRHSNRGLDQRETVLV